MRKRNMLRRALPALLLAAPAVAGFTTTAHALGSTPIDKCGTVINLPGNYELGTSLTCSSGDGVVISADGVVLDLLSFTIEGPGSSTSTGTGIRVTGTGDIVTTSTAAAPAPTLQQIRGFQVGVGVNGATNTRISSVWAAFDGAGFKIQGSTGTTCTFCAANADGTGFTVAGSTGTTLTGVTSDANTGDGVDVMNSSGTVISGEINANSGDGLLIAGLAASGSTDAATEVADSTLDSNLLYGIENQSTLPVGSLGQVGVVTSAEGNKVTGNHGPDDIFEAASGCEGDVWFGNSFGNANQSCVH